MKGYISPVMRSFNRHVDYKKNSTNSLIVCVSDYRIGINVSINEAFLLAPTEIYRPKQVTFVSLALCMPMTRIIERKYFLITYFHMVTKFLGAHGAEVIF